MALDTFLMIVSGPFLKYCVAAHRERTFGGNRHASLLGPCRGFLKFMAVIMEIFSAGVCGLSPMRMCHTELYFFTSGV